MGVEIVVLGGGEVRRAGKLVGSGGCALIAGANWVPRRGG
jgi:hypothetical protein